MSCIPDSLEEAQALFKPLTDKWAGVIIKKDDALDDQIILIDTRIPNSKLYLRLFDYCDSTPESIIHYLDEIIEHDRTCNNYVYSGIDEELGF